MRGHRRDMWSWSSRAEPFDGAMFPMAVLHGDAKSGWHAEIADVGLDPSHVSVDAWEVWPTSACLSRIAKEGQVTMVYARGDRPPGVVHKTTGRKVLLLGEERW